jgi:hypothetical protein
MKDFVDVLGDKVQNYVEYIGIVASLSNLFTTDSSAPYLVSRSTENIFCETLDAKNIGRDDSAIDATIKNYGVGIKTFLHNNGLTLQKIAEFNRESANYRNFDNLEIIRYISKLRNERLQFALNNYGIEKLVYHCITRESSGEIGFYNVPMDFINIDGLQILSSRQNTISFSDGRNDYSFNITKSTLYKRFDLTNDKFKMRKIHVNIIADPYILLKDLIEKPTMLHTAKINPAYEYIVLPLYSFSKVKGKFVPEKSGLNQWNAKGRVRHPDEIYVPIPGIINKHFSGFFPTRDVSFSLELPNGNVLNVKVCQDNDKALMSNPNKDLGEWLLREVLDLRHNEILSYEKLQDIGVDSVRITKLNSETYTIDFCSIGSYDEFLAINQII